MILSKRFIELMKYIGILFALACAVVVRRALYNLPMPFDMYLYIPLVRHWAGTAFGDISGDLLLESGARISFILYRIFAFAIRNGFNESEIFNLAFLVSDILTFLAMFSVATLFTRKTHVAVTISLLFLITSPAFFTLNWSFFPSITPISSAFGTPFGILMISLAWRNRFLSSALFGSLSVLFHPGMGLMASVLSFALWLKNVLSGAPGRFKNVWALALPLLVLFLITGVFFPVSGQISNPQFFEIFRTFSVHAYPEQHVMEGYGIFAVVLMAALYHTKEAFPALYPKILVLILASVGALLLSILNLQFELSYSVALIFLPRVMIYLKVLLWPVILLGVFSFVTSYSDRLKRIIIVLTIAACILVVIKTGRQISLDVDKVWAVVLGIILSVIVILRRRPTWISFLLIAILYGIGLSSLDSSLSSLLIFGGAVGIGSWKILTTRRRDEEWCAGASHHYIPNVPFLAPVSLLLIPLFSTATLLDRAIYCPSELDDIYSWISANTSEESLFIGNPGNGVLGTTFRYCTNRKLYVSAMDICQLAYSPKDYLESYKRLNKFGLRGVDSKATSDGTHIAFFPEFNRSFPQFGLLSKLGIDYLLIDREFSPTDIPDQFRVYSGKRWDLYYISKLDFEN